MNTELKNADRVPIRRYFSFEEFCNTFYRGAGDVNRQTMEEQTASFGKALAKQIIRGEGG